MSSISDDLAICRRLIVRADEMRHRDPTRALELARAGRTLAAGLDRHALGDGPWHLLQAEAWGVLGSALRAVSELDQAEAALNVAITFLDGAGDAARRAPTLAPRLAQRAAYLRAGQRRFDEALELIDEALEELRWLGTDRQLATCLVDRGVILADAGRKRQAVHMLYRALEHHGATMAPRTYLAAVHNVAVFLHDLARSRRAMREAVAWLALAIRCHERFPETLSQLKLHALHGRTAIRLGWLDRGLESLWLAHAGFKRLGALRQQTLNLLDLAAVALQNDRPRDLRSVAGELFPVLGAFGDEPEARLGLLRFQRALHDGTLTTRLIYRVAATMRAATGELAPTP